MQHIWIINKLNSTALFYRNFSNFTLDPDLISGLLTALNSFSEVELKSHGIETIIMGGLAWVYLDLEEFNLLLIAADKTGSNTAVMKARLEVIFKMFIERYSLTKAMLNQPILKQDGFITFTEDIDLLQDQWKQAELIVSGGVAMMYDLLAVFQQIYNMMMKIVRGSFFYTQYRQVMDEIRGILTGLQESPEVKEQPELAKISFDDYGWSVINLNPMALDNEILKRILFILTLHLYNILKEHLSHVSLLNQISKEIFPYIVNNYEHLHQLDVNQPLMKIFLQ